MAAYLLDTHVILWALDEQDFLSNVAKNIITNPEITCGISIISLFEISIKTKIGKLELSKPIGEYAKEVQKMGIKILPISPKHLESYQQIPLYSNHKDPFDRLLIAIALSENLTIISADEKFDYYKDLIKVIW